jgi:hypothetical protein
MPHDNAAAERPQAGPPPWPRYVRVLAVAYVLSYAVQWAALLLLTGAAALLYGLGRPLDGLVLGLGLGGVACAALCAGFRRWFLRWGRRRWPPAGVPRQAVEAAAERFGGRATDAPPAGTDDVTQPPMARRAEKGA